MRMEQRLVFVETAVGSVSENAAINRDSSNVVGAHGLDQCLIEGFGLPAVFLADKNAHHLRLALDFEMHCRRG